MQLEWFLDTICLPIFYLKNVLHGFSLCRQVKISAQPIEVVSISDPEMETNPMDWVQVSRLLPENGDRIEFRKVVLKKEMRMMEFWIHFGI
jgi:hypothetical protein